MVRPKPVQLPKKQPKPAQEGERKSTREKFPSFLARSVLEDSIVKQPTENKKKSAKNPKLSDPKTASSESEEGTKKSPRKRQTSVQLADFDTSTKRQPIKKAKSSDEDLEVSFKSGSVKKKSPAKKIEKAQKSPVLKVTKSKAAKDKKKAKSPVVKANQVKKKSPAKKANSPKVPAKKSKVSPAKKVKSPAQKKSPFRKAKSPVVPAKKNKTVKGNKKSPTKIAKSPAQKAKSPTQKAKSPPQKAMSPAQMTKIRSSSKPCEICGREFLTKQKAKERNHHLAMVHYREEIITNLMRSKEDGENDGNFPCIKCDFSGKTYKNILQHYVRSHKIGQEYLNKDIEAGKLEAKKADYAKSPKAKSPNISLKDIQKGKKSPIEKVKKAGRAAAKAARGALKEPALGTKLRQEPQKAKSPSQKTKNGKAESSTMQEKKKNVPAKKAAKKGNPLAGVTYAASNIRSEMLAIPNGDTEPAKNKKCQKSKEAVSKPAKENNSNAANDNKTEAEIAQFQKEIEEYRKEKQNTKAQAKKPVKSQKEKVKKPKSSKQILEEVSHVSQLEENSFRDAKKSKPNSKTAAGLRNTNQVLKEYNANHEDNLFKPNSTQNR